jgi:RNA polymerase sigma factor (sigma-70 family)
VRVPSHIHQEQRRYRSAEDTLRTTLQREPHLEEVAAQIGCSPEEAERIASCMMPIRSIDEPLGEEGGGTWLDRLEAPEQPEPCVDLDRAAIARVLRVGLSDLPERERQVLTWRFGLGDEEALTLREIGERIGLSRERVRQIQTQALAQLRDRPDVDQLAAHLDSLVDAA